MQDVRDTLLMGSVIDEDGHRYIVESELGKGGSSTIYLVKDQHDEQSIYALKEVIDPDKRDINYLAREYEILTHIEHLSLPRVHRVFKDVKNNRMYALMDYIEGSNLEKLRKQYPEHRLTYTQVFDVMAPIVEAVGFLHSQKPPIVHRDIKPANIIVPPSNKTTYLVDFGIAKRYTSDATTTAVRFCTPGYGAPEQYGVGTTTQTDIYGLGATFYTLLTGTVPVDSFERMLQQSEKGQDPLIRVKELVPTLPNSIAQAVQRAIALRRTDRFATVEEFWQALHPEEDPGEGSLASKAEAQPELEFLSSASQPEQVEASNVNDVSSLASAESLRKQNTVYAFLTKNNRRVTFLLLFFALLTAIGGVGVYQALAIKNAHPLVIQGQSHSTSTVPTSVQGRTPSHVTPMASSQSILYPPLAQRYLGEISDIMANTKNTMSLSNIQQHGSVIQGNFVGLGLVGTFTGSIATDGSIQFRTLIYKGSETLVFQGNVKTGGELAGSYKILNSNQEFTGEYGLWSVSPA